MFAARRIRLILRELRSFAGSEGPRIRSTDSGQDYSRTVNCYNAALRVSSLGRLCGVDQAAEILDSSFERAVDKVFASDKVIRFGLGSFRVTAC